MSKYILLTHSESGDDYTYFIEHPTTPSHEELRKFLISQGNDIFEGESYENIEQLINIDAQNFKKLL